MSDELTRLRAENERLREALRQIANGAPESEPAWRETKSPAGVATNSAKLMHFNIAEIARAALKETSHDG